MRPAMSVLDTNLEFAGTEGGHQRVPFNNSQMPIGLYGSDTQQIIDGSQLDHGLYAGGEMISPGDFSTFPFDGFHMNHNGHHTSDTSPANFNQDLLGGLMPSQDFHFHLGNDGTWPS